MPIQAQSADGQIHEFPDGTPDTVIDRAMKDYASSGKPGLSGYMKDIGKSAVTGVAQGVTGLIGLPGTLSDLASSGLDYVANKVTGANIHTGNSPVSAEKFDAAISKPFGGYYQPQTVPGEYARTLGQFAPSAVIGPSGGLARTASVVAPAVVSETFGQAVKRTPLEPYARMAGAVAGSYLGNAGSALASRLKGAAPAEAESIIPTTQDLKQASGDLYKSALGTDENNFIVSKDALARLRDNVRQTLANEGFKPQLHPATASALDDIESLASNNSTLKGIETSRRVANLGARNFGSADGFLASKVRNSIDDFLENLDPTDIIGEGNSGAVEDLKNARSTWARMQKSAIIDNKLNRAELSAQNFSASGRENAIRTEFRNLAKNQNIMAKFSPDEQQAIQDVAKGTKLANLLRGVGRFAVRGPVSAMGNRVIGSALGGPAGEIALGGIGELGRMGATNATENAARYASELVRGGPELAAEQTALRQAALAKALRNYAPAALAMTPTLIGNNQ